MYSKILPAFQDFLISRNLVPKRSVPYIAHWASKFLSFSNRNEGLSGALLLDKFFNSLRSSNTVEDWQVQQAKDAVRLYLSHFLTETGAATVPPAKEKRLLELSDIVLKMREAIRIKHYAYSTEQSYIDWVRRFYDYITNVKMKDLHSSGFNSDDVRDYLSHLALKKRVSSSTQNQAFNALLFMFRNILKTSLDDLGKTVRAKRGPKLPVVLTIGEVKVLLENMKGTNLLMGQILYGAGLRLMELLSLRIQDVDFDSRLIYVRSGKGDKDRTTILPQAVESQLKIHLERVKEMHEKDIAAGFGEVYLPDALERKYPNAAKEWGWQYLFPSSRLSVDPRAGKIRRHHLSGKAIQNAVRNAARKSGLAKHATVHTLRHCFATHMLMSGINIREVQDLLGHKNVETTMIYTHVLRDMSNTPKSPLDELYRASGDSTGTTSTISTGRR